MSIHNPRFIYSSSPDRGLDTLLNLWGQITKEFPEATLNIFYGFEWWRSAIEQRNDANEKRWMNDILANLNQPGIVNRGRVTQEVLAKEWIAADVWAYPTRFTETYCITALEAQASKTVCVCTDLAGLTTTVADRGILIAGDAYTPEYQAKFLQEVKSILTDDGKRSYLTEKAYQWASKQTWANRAKEWHKMFQSV